MKELFNYCRQPRAYADSVGKCLVELEENETIKDAREKYASQDGWWGTKYTNHHKVEKCNYRDKEYKGNLVLINTQSAYTG